MQVTETVLEIALNEYLGAIAQDPRRQDVRGAPGVLKSMQRDAMRKALTRILRLASNPAASMGSKWSDETVAENGGWPPFPRYEFVQTAANGATKDRLAVASTGRGASVFFAPADTFLQSGHVTVFELSAESALDLSDALSCAAGRIPEGAVTMDKRKADYLCRAEAQLKNTADYLRRLPLNHVTASQIREIDATLESDPAKCIC